MVSTLINPQKLVLNKESKAEVTFIITVTYKCNQPLVALVLNISPNYQVMTLFNT